MSNNKATRLFAVTKDNPQLMKHKVASWSSKLQNDKQSYSLVSIDIVYRRQKSTIIGKNMILYNKQYLT